MTGNVAIIIPALNEAKTIAAVVRPVTTLGQVIVVDDGSTDQTVKVAKDAGALVVSHAQNQGYDAALYSGFVKAMELGADIAVTIDADGQHKPEDVQRFLTCFEHEDVMLVLGVRQQVARFSEWIFRFWTKKAYGIDDILCGLKAYRVTALHDYLSYAKEPTFGTVVAMKMVRDKRVFDQVAIHVDDRADTPRIGRLIRANYLILKAMLRSMTL